MNRRFTTEEFIEKSRKFHGDKYNYQNTVYVTHRHKVEIECKKHGIFIQMAASHMHGMGCKMCATDEMIIRKKQKARDIKLDFAHIIPPVGGKVVPLTQSKYALVSEEDYEIVNQYNWSAAIMSNTEEYLAKACINGKTIRMHNLILKTNKVIDHINNNPLDNRRENLRICSQHQNIMNNRGHKNSTSKYKGVSWQNRSSKWVVQITHNRKVQFSKLFIDEEEAARAYDKKAKELFGEYAHLNFRENDNNF